MSPALAQREIALAAIALLAAIVSLALTSHGSSAKTRGLLQPVTLQGGQWRTSLAGASPTRYGRRTTAASSSSRARSASADSVLPCGVKLYFAYGNSPQILTQVIEHRPVPPGRTFELTPRLAEKLGIDGVQKVRWVFAGTAPGYTESCSTLCVSGSHMLNQHRCRGSLRSTRGLVPEATWHPPG